MHHWTPFVIYIYIYQFMPKYFMQNISKLLILSNWQTMSHLWNFIINNLLFFVCACCPFSVTALSMSPVDWTFLSSSLDMTIRFWDLRSPNCQVTLHFLVHCIWIVLGFSRCWGNKLCFSGFDLYSGKTHLLLWPWRADICCQCGFKIRWPVRPSCLW